MDKDIAYKMFEQAVSDAETILGRHDKVVATAILASNLIKVRLEYEEGGVPTHLSKKVKP